MSSEHATPAKAVLAAGGAKEEAALNRVRLVRATEERPILLDLRPNAESPLPEKAQRLHQGDILVVPERQAILIGGGQGGMIPLRGGETLIDVIVAGQVNAKDFKLNEIRVVRANNIRDEKKEVEEYDLEEFFKSGESEFVGVPINDGDMVFVPRRGGGFNFLNAIGIARNLLFFGI